MALAETWIQYVVEKRMSSNGTGVRASWFSAFCTEYVTGSIAFSFKKELDLLVAGRDDLRIVTRSKTNVITEIREGDVQMYTPSVPDDY